MADLANLLRCLITPQVFPGRLIAVQPVVSQRISLRANKGVLVQYIGKTILFGRVGEPDRGDISGNANQFQSPVDRTCIITAIQGNFLHWNSDLYLPLQTPQYKKALPLIGRIHVHPGQYAVFTVYCRLQQIADTALVPLVDIAAVRACRAGRAALFHCLGRWTFESGLFSYTREQ